MIITNTILQKNYLKYIKQHFMHLTRYQNIKVILTKSNILNTLHPTLLTKI